MFETSLENFDSLCFCSLNKLFLIFWDLATHKALDETIIASGFMKNSQKIYHLSKSQIPLHLQVKLILINDENLFENFHYFDLYKEKKYQL